MTKGAWIAVGSFVALLALVLVFALKPAGTQQPELKIPGWHKGPAEVSEPEKDGPVDKLVVSYKGETITATRDEKDKKVWHLAKPKGARADIYKIRSVLNLFKDPIESSFSSIVDKQDIKAFGFDKDSVIHVTLYKGGEKLVDVEIGAAQKNDETGGQSSTDTWIRLPGKHRAFRVLGKDMRWSFGKDLSRFRDRKVFAFDSDQIMGLELTNPQAKDPRDRHIVLKAELQQQDKKAEKDKKDKEKPKKTWHIQVPAGYKAGNVSSYLSRVAGLYAQEFLKDLPKDVKFDENAFKVRITLDKGKERKIVLSGQYARIDGLEGYVKLSEYAADGLRKGLSEFRDKHVWNAPRETVREVALSSDKGRLVLRRSGNVWKAVVPAGLKLDDDKRERLLKDIEELTVADFERPSPEALRKAKFDSPWVRCQLTMEDGHKLELVIGGMKKGGRRYARVTGQKDLLVMSTYMANKLYKAPKDLAKTAGKDKK
jgi:hypothetical protein